MDKNILFISIDGLSDPLGQSQIIPYLKCIANSERNIKVIIFEKNENIKKNKKSIKISLLQNINWKYSNYILGLGKLGNFINYLKLFCLCLYLVIFKILIIHCRGTFPHFLDC